jgi:uncharacterized YccA/Bax inhibitor family protein
MKRNNPALNNKVFRGHVLDEGETMTLQGAVNKTAFLLTLLVTGAGWTWNLFYTQGSQAVMPWLMIGVWGGFVAAIIVSFTDHLAPLLAPVYAVLEGLALGGLSAYFEAKYPGVVIQAVGLTFSTLGGLLLVYKLGLVKVTDNFKLGVIAATAGIGITYLLGFIGCQLGLEPQYLHQSSLFGILFSILVVIVAALNLVLDFDDIKSGVGSAPKSMEWIAAFGLIVSLVWLYVEFLRLIARSIEYMDENIDVDIGGDIGGDIDIDF